MNSVNQKPSVLDSHDTCKEEIICLIESSSICIKVVDRMDDTYIGPTKKKKNIFSLWKYVD